jgi:acyl-homoserine lactone acylase PvdQ
VHAQRVLAGIENVTLDGLIELAYDPYLPGFEQLIPALVAAYGRAGDDYPELEPAIDALRGWDFSVRVDSVPMTLAHFYGMRYRDEGRNPRGLRGKAQIDHFAVSSPDEERLRIFAKTVAMLEADFGQWNTPWGEINRYQRLSGDIDLEYDDSAPSLAVGLASGDWGALASYRAKRYPGTKRIYGTSGNSFVAVVEFGDRVRAKSMLAGGQSGDPASPHFDDQAERYAARQFKDVAFYPEDVEARAVRRYQPGD